MYYLLRKSLENENTEQISESHLKIDLPQLVKINVLLINFITNI